MKQRTPADGRSEDARRLERWRRTERTMLFLRWAGVAFGVVQVLTYYRPHPPGFLPLALGLVGLLAAGNVALGVVLRRVHTAAAAQRLGMAALTLDGAVVMGFVFIYTFDVDTAMWALIYVLPLEGAIRFQLTGALTTMGLATLAYALRELFGAVRYGNEFFLTSVSFRMGIGFLIAAVAGVMASNLVRERNQLEDAKRALEEYAAELAAANTELQRAARMKDDFLAMANHELRTPLTAVLGYASMLAEGWHDVPEPRRHEFVESIRHQARRLQGLVEDLLALSALQAGALNMSIQRVDLVAAVDDAIHTTPDAAEHVDNACPPGLTVRADPQWLLHILTNYLSNALKYGAAPVTVEAAARDERIEIRVRDCGQGVPEEFVPRLFEKFSRADGRSAMVNGTGLGLAIVRLLAEAQSGRAWYEPAPPHGSVFCVSLPAGAAPERAARQASRHHGDVDSS